MLNRKKIAIFICSMVVASGCIPPHRAPRLYNPMNPIKRVVVLPMKNETLDVGGPDMVRAKIEQAFRDRGYNVRPIAESDQILRDQMGINLGGQLEMTTPQKLGEVLGVEGVIYGDLMDFDETTTGIYNVKKVRAKFRFVNTATGDVIWGRGLGVKSEVKTAGIAGGVTKLAATVKDARDSEVPWVMLESHTAQGGIGESLAIGLGSKLLSKAVGKHLDHESTELVRRVTHDLPWGPGPGEFERPEPVPPPVVIPPMPEVKAPRTPSFGYMDYGRKDFTAVMVSTSVDRKSKETYTFDAPIAKAGDSFRIDMDMARMAKGQGEMPPALSKMVLIHRGERKMSFTLYPNKQKYMVHPETDEQYLGEEPRVEKVHIGREKIDTHPTDKYKVKIIYKDGEVQEGLIWIARDLGGMTIRTELEHEGIRSVTELKNISLKKPPVQLFEIPPGFTEVKGFMELMMDEAGK